MSEAADAMKRDTAEVVPMNASIESPSEKQPEAQNPAETKPLSVLQKIMIGPVVVVYFAFQASKIVLACIFVIFVIVIVFLVLKYVLSIDVLSHYFTNVKHNLFDLFDYMFPRIEKHQ